MIAVNDDSPLDRIAPSEWVSEWVSVWFLQTHIPESEWVSDTSSRNMRDAVTLSFNIPSLVLISNEDKCLHMTTSINSACIIDHWWMMIEWQQSIDVKYIIAVHGCLKRQVLTNKQSYAHWQYQFVVTHRERVWQASNKWWSSSWSVKSDCIDLFIQLSEPVKYYNSLVRP